MSWRKEEGGKGDMTRSPLGRTCRSPWTSETAVPSESDHQMRTGGAPATLQVTTVPESLRKCTLGGGSTKKRGPWRLAEGEASEAEPMPEELEDEEEEDEEEEDEEARAKW